MTNKNIMNWFVAFAFLASAPAIALAAPAETPMAGAQAQQSAECTGVVYDETGEPLIGASVKVVGATIGDATNIDGEFRLRNVAPGSTIEVNYIGYKPAKVKWTGAPLEITLEPNTTALDEVVVMGYGVSQKRANVTNSIAKVSEQTLTVGTHANPAQALAGAVSGVKVAITSGSPAATPSITLRGGTNFDGGSNQPLVIVDGNIRDSMSDINPNDIASMEILKDAGATALYGARAGNGVILITTKSGQAGTGKVTFSGKVGLSYYNNGYSTLSDEDAFYLYRVGTYNTPWMQPGAQYNGNLNTMLFGNNQPFAIGRTEWSNTMNYNVLAYNDNTAYLISDEYRNEHPKSGWAKMKDPVSDREFLYWNQDLMSLNLRKPAVTQDYNISFSGGNDRGKYYASLGYYDAEGMVKTTFYKRYNFALTGEYKLTNWLTSNSVFNYTRANWLNDDPNLDTVYFMNRGFMYKNVRYYDEDGNNLYGTSSPTYNVNINKGNFDRDYQSDKFSMTQSFTAKIIDGLSLKGTMSWYYNEEVHRALNKTYITNQVGAANPDGTNGVNRSYSMSGSFTRYFDQTYNLVANYNKTFNEKHNLAVMLGMEFYKRRYLTMSASGSNAPAPFWNLGLTANTSDNLTRSISSSQAEEALSSYFGRVDYNYEGKYIVGATFREDGYSRLVNKRWGFFPGVSAGWVMSQENFWKENADLGWWNYAKIRASYGTNAIINRKMLGYYTLRGSYGAYKYNGNTGYRISALPNPDLKWETAKTFEVGVDFGFFQNRINARATYYNRTTVDKYANLSLPRTTGFSSVTDNNGSYRNQGVEMDVEATILNINDFRWSINANLTYNKNRVVKLPENGLPNNRQGGVEVYTGNGDETYFIGGYQEGQNPYNQVGFGSIGIARNQAQIDALGNYIDVVGTVGVYANEEGRKRLLDMGYAATNVTPLLPGDLIYEDRNGDGIIDSKDQKIIGHRDASWSGGFNTTLSWKGISLYARFDMGWGFQVFDSNMSFWLAEGQGAMSFPEQGNDTWRPDVPGAAWPKIAWASQYGTQDYVRTNDLLTQPGRYLACRELMLSYSLPADLCHKFACQGLTVSVTGQNLGYIKKTTLPLPDNVTYWNGNTAGNGGTYNLPRTVLFGLNMTF